ncbi:helix-turn-helix domain-containing protein [Geomicrobium sp. JSM 1781026]|uniref:helix-turn-helix domain-containing protein n=1 Tax=Geomicrobium sp. JSM 1781026 TaxID=3344580 RepID=UPI0035BEC8A7
MTHPHSSTEKRTFSHLSAEERGEINGYQKQRLGVRQIGEAQNRSPSMISHALKRGTVAHRDSSWKRIHVYFPDIGTRVYRKNRSHYRRKRSRLLEAARPFHRPMRVSDARK